jgi:hypothetical protein
LKCEIEKLRLQIAPSPPPSPPEYRGRGRKIAALLLVLAIAGCAHPSAANNKLRDENQKLQDQITTLERNQQADHATIKALEGKQGIKPSISSAKIDQLFTVHGIKLARLTSADQNGLEVAVQPIDDQGDKVKAAGTFVIDAFDLAAGGDNHIGRWTFDAAQSRDAWNGISFLYCYVLKCPWQKKPQHADVTVRVAYTDLLTGRQFTEQKVVKLDVQSPTTRPH